MIASIALMFALAGSPAPAAAATTAPPTPADAPTPAPATSPAPASAPDDRKEPGGLRFVWKEHPSLRAGKWLRLDFGAKLQEDKLNPGDDPANFDDLVLRRARLGVDGELFKFLQFSIEREFTKTDTGSERGESGKTQWRDLFGEIKIADGLQIRGGRFKVPFSRDQLDGEASNDFVARSLGGAYLAPGRDVGGMVHGRFFKRGLEYNVGVFEHDGDNARAKKIAGGDRTFAARLVGTPLRRVKLMNLDEAEVGASFASTDVADTSSLPNGLRGRTVVSQFVYFEPVFVKGTRRRYGLDAEWSKRQFGARGEYMRVTDKRINQGLRGDSLNDARYAAWYVSGAWVLTGEKSEKAIAPKRPLFMGGFGALQLAARYERIRFDSEATGEPAFSNSRAEVILPNGDKVFTAGLNWYLNRWMKLQFNAVHEDINDPGRTPLLDGGTKFWSTVIRAQLAL